MKSQWLLTMVSGGLVWLGATTLLVGQAPITGVPPLEQTTPLDEQETRPAEMDVDTPDEAPTNELAIQQKAAISCRLGELIGMSVNARDGTKLGSIEDVVFDANSGAIRYAAVAHGGFLGFGKKLVAVPWDAFEVQVTARQQRGFRPEAQPYSGVISGDRVQLTLDIDAKTLEQHPGFEKDSWPESGDASLVKEKTQEAPEALPAKPLESQVDEPATEAKDDEPATEAKDDEPAAEAKDDEPATEEALEDELATDEAQKDEPATEGQEDEAAEEEAEDQPAQPLG